MTWRYFCTFVIWTSISLTNVSCAPDYYWRDFNGTIPDDAVVAVYDGIEEGFVGNVLVYQGGLFVGELKRDVPSITISGLINGQNEVRTVNKYIKILCTLHPGNFEWIPANLDTLPYITEHLVVGGWETEVYGVNYIGRIIYQNRPRIGKVVGFEDGSGHYLRIPIDGVQMNYASYEVLSYKEYSKVE